MRCSVEDGKIVVLLIPALDPDEHLLRLLENLSLSWEGPVLLVDDGSGPKAKAEVFPAAESMG